MQLRGGLFISVEPYALCPRMHMPNFSDSMNYDENIMLLFNILQPTDHAA